MSDEREVVVRLTERDRSALHWAVPMLRGLEKQYESHAGIREGEATSDVLAAIHTRAERALANPQEDEVSEDE